MSFQITGNIIIWFYTITKGSWLITICVRYTHVLENLTVFNLHATFNVTEVCRPIEAATLTALHFNSCPCSHSPTLYVKSDITVYVSLAVLWLNHSVAFNVTYFCPIVHCNVALGRLPVVLQVTSSGFASSMLSIFPLIVGGSGLTEIYT